MMALQPRIEGDLTLLKWMVGASLAVAGFGLAATSTTLWFVVRLVTKVEG